MLMRRAAALSLRYSAATAGWLTAAVDWDADGMGATMRFIFSMASRSARTSNRSSLISPSSMTPVSLANGYALLVSVEYSDWTDRSAGGPRSSGSSISTPIEH